MVDEDVILERLRLLRDYVSDLQAEQGVSLQRYLDDKMLRRYVERTLQTAVQVCLDIGHHIISYEGFRYPADNRDVFAVLAEEKIVPGDLLPRLQDMAGFRNILVHEYAALDDTAVYGVLKKRLGDFNEFAKAITRYLEKARCEEP